MVRKITNADFDFIYRLYMHPAVNPYLLYEPMDAASFQPIFEELVHKGILYIFADEGIEMGMFKMVPFDYRSSHVAYLGGIAIDPAFGGRGWGTKMMQEILVRCKSLGLERIELSTAVTNEKAIRLYEKVGFVREGVLRKYTFLKSENRFLDEVLMAYLY